MASSTVRLDYHTYDVFTTTPFEGNPLAVIHVPSTTPLSPEVPQRLAREFNYSETVTLYLPPKTTDGVPTYDVRIFLTTAEIPLAGHPVIGTATHIFEHLSPEAKTICLATKAGPCTVSRGSDGKITAAMPHELHFHSTKAPLDIIRVQQPALANADIDVQTVTLVRGMNFVFARLPDLATLGAMGDFVSAHAPKLSWLDDGWQTGEIFMVFYVLTGEGTARTRFLEGTFEDPATGSASCALAAMLSRQGRGETWALTQGVEMGRRSEIGVAVTRDGDKVTGLALSGTAVEVMRGSVRAA